MFVYCLEEEEE